ncbi:hypothetical protein CBM2634_U20012 [Cupriavidus taiwanensis]|uniref:Uncharacterized protein n=1 Tax=Cupriavidus taiwanensis TaxID=164546 RepID=A0A375JBY4_9BURK|nr:hypothetical protein CBM2634_U20012 [Cupriavidus taiwanensis]
MATGQFLVGRVLFGGHVFREQRISVALALLLAREGGHAAGAKVDWGVAFESGQSHGRQKIGWSQTKMPAPHRSQGARRTRFAKRYSPGPAGSSCQ